MTPRPERLSKARFRKLARATVVGAAVSAVALGMSPAGPTAHADPDTKPDTVAEAKALVEKLEHESGALDQKYVAAKEKYDNAKKSLAAKKRDLAAQEKKVAELRKAVAAIALAEYQNRGIDTTTKLIVSSSPDALLRDLSLQERMTERQRTTLQSYQTQLANLADLRRAAETDEATMGKATKDMAAARKASKAKLSEAEQILQRLTEEERRRIEAERRAAAEAARQAAEAAEREQQRRTTNTSRNNSRNQQESTPKPKTEAPPPPPPASGRAAAAVASAKSKVGSPYVYGGTGPGYDCSGLTMTSWAAAGVRIPRTSQAQYSGTRRISRGELQPGDLVFYYSGISHVAMYVGNGTIVHAPNSRSRVRYDAIGSMPIAGYGRVG